MTSRRARCFRSWLPRLLALGLLGAGGASCARPLDRPQYLAYLADPAHGLTQTRVVNGTSVTCAYRPTDLLLNQELASADPAPSPAQLDSLRRGYAGRLYCTLALARDSAELEASVIRDEAALSQTLIYLSTGIARDVYLRGLGQADSTAALAATYVRQYGATGRSAVLLVFPAPRLDGRQGFTLTYHDTRFGLGPVHFIFTPEALRALPTLKT